MSIHFSNSSTVAASSRFPVCHNRCSTASIDGFYVVAFMSVLIVLSVGGWKIYRSIARQRQLNRAILLLQQQATLERFIKRRFSVPR